MKIPTKHVIRALQVLKVDKPFRVRKQELTIKELETISKGLKIEPWVLCYETAKHSGEPSTPAEEWVKFLESLNLSEKVTESLAITYNIQKVRFILDGHPRQAEACYMFGCRWRA